MADILAEKIQSKLRQYSQTVENVQTHLDQLEPYGRYSASTPVVLRGEIAYLLEYSADLDIDTARHRREFEEINSSFEEFRTAADEEYSKKLQSELAQLVNGYPGLICYFMDLDPVELELVNNLNIRDLIEYLLIDLDGEVNIQKEITKVANLDEVFECVYRKHLGEIREMMEAEHGPEIEKSYLPDRFWWRHPSEIDG